MNKKCIVPSLVILFISFSPLVALGQQPEFVDSLGAAIQDINKELVKSFNLSTKKGVLVTAVRRNSLAEKAGMLVGDVIVEYGGKKIKNVKYLRDRIDRTTLGEVVKIRVLRDGGPQDLNLNASVTFEEQPPSRLSSPSFPREQDIYGLDAQPRFGGTPEITDLSQLPAERKAMLLERLQRELCPCCGMTLFACMSQDPGCEHRLPAIQRLLAEVMADTRKASPPLDQQKKHTLKSGQPIEATKFQKFASPGGFYTVSIPVGWECQSSQDGTETDLTFHPPGREQPSVGILLVEATTMYFKSHMGRPSSSFDIDRKVSAKDFLQQALVPFLESAYPNLRVESIVSRSSSVAELSASTIGTGEDAGVRLKGKVICTMTYVQDPSAGRPNAWLSLALVKGMSAYETEISAFEPVATRIFQSFRPTERWMGNYVEFLIVSSRQQLIQSQERLNSQVGRTLKNLGDMDREQQISEMQSRDRINRGWIDALGGTTRLTDPNSPGSEYKRSDTNKYYFEEGGRTYGTDDYRDLKGPGRTPLVPSR